MFSRKIGVLTGRGGTLVALFKTTNSLTRHGLCPSLFGLCGGNCLTRRFTLLNASQHPLDSRSFRRVILGSIGNVRGRRKRTRTFTGRFFFRSRSIAGPRRCAILGRHLRRLSGRFNTRNGHLFCVSVTPRFFNAVTLGLGGRSLLAGSNFGHLIVRGPFNHSCRSTGGLGSRLSRAFGRGRVFQVSRCLNGRVIRGVRTLHFNGAVVRSL